GVSKLGTRNRQTCWGGSARKTGGYAFYVVSHSQKAPVNRTNPLDSIHLRRNPTKLLRLRQTQPPLLPTT
ncbi:MAG: hypothetical protein ACETV1_04115, partial [Candidatus Bathyarchaeia archaeon]